MFPQADPDLGLLSSEQLRGVSESETHTSATGVLVCDERRMSASRVSRVVEQAGGRVCCWLDDFSAAASMLLVAAGRAQLALVSLDENPAATPRSLSLIGALKQKGLKVLAYGEGAQAWPIGRRCQALLAGALALFDTSADEFCAELRLTLMQLLRAEAGRREEEEELKGRMRRLGVIGESSQMLAVFRAAWRASLLSDLPALITGETGTGKELLVNAIFQLDQKRRRGPFVALNCSAISPGLAESELFGHRRGAFTGAERDRKGLIRSADEGVLFLDEIGDLDDALQAKLLRVLQEKRVLGLGEDREVAINVRVIAATNRNLEELVRRGKFRADLFHRLNTLSIHLPPLRQRPADLRPLVEHFLARDDAPGQAQPLRVAPEFIEAMSRMELPGNARQLENLVRRAVVNKQTDAPLNLSDLPSEVWRELSALDPSAHSAQGAPAGMPSRSSAEPSADLSTQLAEVLARHDWNLSDSLAHCERLLVASALQHTNGNQAQTARLLGITPRSVYNKLRKHQLH